MLKVLVSQDKAFTPNLMESLSPNIIVTSAGRCKTCLELISKKKTTDNWT